MARPSSNPKTKQLNPHDAFTIPGGLDIEGRLEFKPPEDPDAKRHRLRHEVWSFWVKEASTYIVALLVLLMTAAYCFWILFFKAGTDLEERR